MKPWLKWTLRIVGGILGVVLLIVIGGVIYVQSTWDKPSDRPVPVMTAQMDPATVARGEFIYKYAAACWGCHSPNRRIDELPSGGYVEDLREFGPGFGLFYVKNITPDVETGIGAWTDGELVRAVREGIGRDGRTFFIMPSRVFNKMADDDVLALVAYLKSLPPGRNPLPPHEYSFFVKALYAFGLIKPEPHVTEAVKAPPRGVTPEWGKYLANHVATCSDCHTSFDQGTGTFHNDSLFMGGNFRLGEPFGKAEEDKIDPIWAFGPNLTPDEETGLGKWTEDDFVRALKSGMGPDGKVRVATAMPYPYYKMWEEDDLRAVYRYLKTLTPTRRPTPPPFIYSKDITEGSGVPRGKALFKAYCKDCHGENGMGAPATKVKLGEVAHSIDNIIMKQFISEGQMNLFMPSFKNTLTSEQLDDVIAYIRTWEKK
jgi:mono/diheme cytochrome c family protein